jgi:mono/diheme cytochrome c family protein
MTPTVVPAPRRTPPLVLVAIAGLAALYVADHAAAATPAELLAGYRASAGSPPAPDRGQKLFTVTHGREWSCASCHGATPTQPGRHASTGKPIAPLAPAFDPQRFTDPAKVEKWFRRNCNDVMGRECTAAEKADVLSWLTTLTP